MVGNGFDSDATVDREEFELFNGGLIVKLPWSVKDISRVNIRKAEPPSLEGVVKFRSPVIGDTGFSESDLMSVDLVFARVRVAMAGVAIAATGSAMIS